MGTRASRTKSRVASSGIVAALVTVAFALGAPAANAAAPSNAVCSFSVPIKFSANSQSTRLLGPRGGTFAATRLGQIDCLGRINGQLVRGTGSILMKGTYRAMGTCALGSGAGYFNARVPRLISLFDQGYEQFEGDFNYGLVGGVWRGAGALLGTPDSVVHAVAALSASEGSCLGQIKSGTLSGHMLVD